MADKFLTDLDAANAVSGTDQILLAQGSPIPRRAPVSMLKDALFAVGTFTRNLLNAADANAVKLLLGLNRLDNTNDLEKPISTATAAALAGKAASSHTHSQADVTGLSAALSAKLDSSSFTWGALPGKPSTFAPSAHSHPISEVTGLQTALDAKLATVDFTWTGLSGKPATFTPSAHTHAMSEVTGLTSALAAKQDKLPDFASADGKVLTVSSGALVWLTPTGGGGGGGDMFKADNLFGLADPAEARANLGVNWANLTGKPLTFTPSAHTHEIAEVNGLQSALDGKAAASHTHTIANVTGLQAALDGKQAAGSYVTSASFTWTNLSGKPTEFTPAAHTHVIADVTNLQTTLNAKLDTATFNTHGHTIAGVSGLQAALDAKAPTTTPTFSGQTTINGSCVVTNCANVGTAGGSEAWGEYYKTTSGNDCAINARWNRTAAGSDWTGMAWEWRRITDAVEQQTFRFTPISSGNAFSFRYGGNNLLVISTGGDITALGNVTAYSDRRLKRDIEPLAGAAEKALALRPVSYTWRRSGERDFGLIAQEVEELFPEVVVTDKETDIKSVDYGRLVVPLIQAVQELSARVRELEARHGAA